MKKLTYLLFITPLFLVACIRPPVPDVEQAIQEADPNTIIPLSSESADGYFRTALPVESSPTRGLILYHIQNRADIEQVELSLMRLATDVFDPDEHFIREGQYLSRSFVSSVLRAHNPEPEDFNLESEIGLNPPFGSTHTFGSETVENLQGDMVRPFAYVLEHNFVTIEDNEFQLEGVAIAIALNPYHWIIDRNVGFEQELRMSDTEILAIGEDIAADLVPLLREQEGLENVPIFLGLFILKSEREVIPGHFARVAYIEEGRSSIASWDSVQERHFRLPDPTDGIHTYDINITDEFNAFRNTITNYFPHRYGLVARVHIVDGNVYRILIDFNMSFLGLSEKIAFHQLLEQEVMNFSPEYDIRIIVRSPDEQHGAVVRPPGGEASVHRISW